MGKMEITAAVKGMDRLKKNMLFFKDGEWYYFSSEGQKGKNYGVGLYGLFAGLRTLKTENPGLLEEHVKGGLIFPFIRDQVGTASLAPGSLVFDEFRSILTPDKSIPEQEDYQKRYEIFIEFMQVAKPGLVYTHDEAIQIILDAVETGGLTASSKKFLNTMTNHEFILQNVLNHFASKVEPSLNPEVLNPNGPNLERRFIDADDLCGLLPIYCALRYGMKSTGYTIYPIYGRAFQKYLEQQSYLRPNTVSLVQQGEENAGLCFGPDDVYTVVYLDSPNEKDTWKCKYWMMNYAPVGSQYIALEEKMGNFPDQYFRTERIEVTPEESGSRPLVNRIHTKTAVVPAAVAFRYSRQMYY